MSKRTALTALMAAMSLSLAVSIVPAGAAVSEAYHITQSIPLGAPEKWDYLNFDAVSNRLFAAHGNRIDVIDLSSNTIAGQVPVDGANGTAIVTSIGKGYAGSRGGKSAVIFDLNSYKVLKTIPVGEDSDAVVYDPFSRGVFLMQGDPHSITVIDTTTDAVASTIHLSGQPEFAAVDGAGKLYVNIEDKRQIQRIDTKSGKVDATWSIAACDSPHGLAIDTETRRLFTSCVNSKLLVINAIDGAIVSTLPIGKYTDAAAYDPRTKRVFSSNGDGTLTVIQQEGANRYKSLGEVATQLGARTMAIDPTSGRIFMLTGEYKTVDPSAKDLRQRYSVEPGSVRVLILEQAAVH